jgi:hypothetical protein
MAEKGGYDLNDHYRNGIVSLVTAAVVSGIGQLNGLTLHQTILPAMTAGHCPP